MPSASDTVPHHGFSVGPASVHCCFAGCDTCQTCGRCRAVGPLFGGCQCNAVANRNILRPPKPFRVQLRRTKGWRLPPLTKVVARPSKWGNPWRVGDPILVQWPYRPENRTQTARGFNITPEMAVAFYRVAFSPDVDEIRDELLGMNLACWCPLDQPCHADVLLELANGATDAV